MRVGRHEGGCDDHHGDRVHHGLCEHALHDGEVHGEAHGEVRDEGVLHGEGGDGGEALQESQEECEGWASEMKAHRHEVVVDERLPRAREVGEEAKVLCDHGDGQVHEVVHGVHEEGHVFYRDEPKAPRIPDPQKD